MPTQLTFAQRAEQSLTLKAGDRKPVLQAALRRGRVRDSAVDLSDAAEIRLYLQNDETGDLLVNQAMDVVDAENGIVEYEFGVGDTVQGGRNELEIVVTWADNRPETFPKRGYGVMQVSEPLDRELDPADLDDADISVTILRVDELRANTGQSVSVEDDLQFNGNDATGFGSVHTEKLENGGEIRNLIGKFPEGGGPTNSISFDVDMDTYDRMEMRLLSAAAIGADPINLTIGGAADGDYIYVERNGTVFTERPAKNQITLCDTSQEGHGEFVFSFETRDITIANGFYRESIGERPHTISGEIDGSSTSGSETFNLDVADLENRIEEVRVVGVVET